MVDRIKKQPGGVNVEVKAPRYQNIWNPNTIMLFIAVSSGLVAYGYAWQRYDSLHERSERSIERIGVGLETQAIRTDTIRDRQVDSQREVDNHAVRLGLLERQFNEEQQARHSIQRDLNALTTEMRVIREIVERIEETSSRVNRGGGAR